jgi:acetylornithine deacetylase/succinyl-diaminopimelate desuccinylase-like protein
MQAFFHVLAAHLEFLEAYRGKKDPAVLLKLLEESGLTELPVLNAVLRDTVSLTMFHAGSKINVIPDEAEAQLDCRLLPETEEEEFLDFLRRALDDPGMEIERVKHMGKAPSSPFDGDIYGAIEKAVGEEYPGSLAAPFMLSGLSDSRFFRARGVPCYGIIPARLSLADLPRIHGVDERISVEDVKRGVRFIHAVVTGICS